MKEKKIEKVGKRRNEREEGRVEVVGGKGMMKIKVEENMKNEGKENFMVNMRGEEDNVIYNYENKEI